MDSKGKIVYTNYEVVISMCKKQQEKQEQQRNQNKFNSVTQKVKPENQNQTHNIRSEAVEPKNGRYKEVCPRQYCMNKAICPGAFG